MSYPYKCILLFSLIHSVCLSNAQDKIVHGFVTTFDSIPLVGAEIKAKNTKHIVFTDTLGYFSVVVNNNDKLSAKAKGFYKQSIKLNKQIRIAAINLTLKPGTKNKSIATGYGYVQEENKISAVAGFDNSDFNFSVYNNIYELIQGRIPGVLIENGEVIIRGPSSINCSNAAMIVVDGITKDKHVLNSISPNEVKNISVIKDASSAIYGFQGVNGVLIIETKKAGNNGN